MKIKVSTSLHVNIQIFCLTLEDSIAHVDHITESRYIVSSLSIEKVDDGYNVTGKHLLVKMSECFRCNDRGKKPI